MSNKIEQLCNVDLDAYRSDWKSYIPLKQLKKHEGVATTSFQDHGTLRLDQWIVAELREVETAPSVVRQVDELFDVIFLVTTSLTARLSDFSEIASSLRRVATDAEIDEAHVVEHARGFDKAVERLGRAHEFIRTSPDLMSFMNCAHSMSNTSSQWMHREIDPSTSNPDIFDYMPGVARLAAARVRDASSELQLVSEHLMILFFCSEALFALDDSQYIHCYFRWLSKQHSRNREIDGGVGMLTVLNAQFRRFFSPSN